MSRFFVGFFIAAFVCGVLFLCGATAEAGVLGSLPDIQCAAPVIAVKPVMHFIVLLMRDEETKMITIEDVEAIR